MAQSCHTDGKVEKSFEIEDPIKINHKVTYLSFKPKVDSSFSGQSKFPENLTIVLSCVPTS